MNKKSMVGSSLLLLLGVALFPIIAFEDNIILLSDKESSNDSDLLEESKVAAYILADVTVKRKEERSLVVLAGFPWCCWSDDSYGEDQDLFGKFKTRDMLTKDMQKSDISSYICDDNSIDSYRELSPRYNKVFDSEDDLDIITKGIEAEIEFHNPPPSSS